MLSIRRARKCHVYALFVVNSSSFVTKRMVRPSRPCTSHGISSCVNESCSAISRLPKHVSYSYARHPLGSRSRKSSKALRLKEKRIKSHPPHCTQHHDHFIHRRVLLACTFQPMGHVCVWKAVSLVLLFAVTRRPSPVIKKRRSFELRQKGTVHQRNTSRKQRSNLMP